MDAFYFTEGGGHWIWAGTCSFHYDIPYSIWLSMRVLVVTQGQGIAIVPPASPKQIGKQGFKEQSDDKWFHDQFITVEKRIRCVTRNQATAGYG